MDIRRSTLLYRAQLLVFFGACILLSGCTNEVSPQRALANCIAREVRSMQRGARDEGVSDFANDLQHRIAQEECRKLYTACESDPNSRACLRFRGRFSKTPKKLPHQR